MRRRCNSITLPAMKIAILNETFPHENRVAATPDTVKRFIDLGADVCIQSGAGEGADISDAAYIDARADTANTADQCVKNADIVLCVRPPEKPVLSALKKGALLVGMLAPYEKTSAMTAYADAGIAAFALELLPRISRAQSMDVLSSQSNLAGYRAVIDAVAELGKVLPMMMTAAGTIRSAKVLILGAGVAGLQAIATARRLGGVVSAFDVRPAVKEQVESLGATFVEVPADDKDAETSGGYAREMSEAYKQKQAELIAKTAASQDIIITTALIPGKPAPLLIDKTTLEAMKPGAVIVDLAASAGGNTAVTKPDKTVEHFGVKVMGPTNLPGKIAADASALYARNLFNFVSTLLIEKKKPQVSWDDELVKGTCLSKDGKIVHPQFTRAAPKKKPAAKKPAAPRKTTAAKKPATTKKTAAAKKPAAAPKKSAVAAKKPSTATKKPAAKPAKKEGSDG